MTYVPDSLGSMCPLVADTHTPENKRLNGWRTALSREQRWGAAVSASSGHRIRTYQAVMLWVAASVHSEGVQCVRY